ncbi:MAG TPA: hypothetical protein VEA15_03450 [Caulobacteraceae bacterium]|nr:hypothetical protein [Caulobacteraceae bacterium]
MARKPRVYVAEVDGVHEWVVAAPNQRAALDAFGVNQDLFAQGRARVAEEPDAIEAAQADPGKPLRRLAGSTDPFRSAAEDPGGGWAAALAAAPKPAGRTKAAPTLPRAAGAKSRAGAPAPPPPSPPARPPRKTAPPRRKAPDRRPLMKAEAELTAFGREEARALGEIARDRAALDRREAKLRADLEKRRDALQRAVDRARRTYEQR